MKFVLIFCLALCFAHGKQPQFLNFWKNSDAFSEKIYFSFENKVNRKLFMRKYERLREAVLFYKDHGVCESSITLPTYEEVQMLAFDEDFNSGENVKQLGTMLDDWIKSYACIEDTEKKNLKIFERTLDSIHEIAADAEQDEEIELVMSNSTMNYNKARAYCFLKHLSLVNSKDDDQLEIITEILDSDKEFWLDGSNSFANPEEDSCFTMQNNSVNRQNCSDNHFAVCKSRKSYYPPATTTTTTIRSTTTMAAEPSEVSILALVKDLGKSFYINGDGSTKLAAKINAPTDFFIESSKSALVNGQLYIFGGNIPSDKKRIARLENCEIIKLVAELNDQRDSGSEVISISEGTAALICFNANYGQMKSCEIFDGIEAVETNSTSKTHVQGGLALYKNQPTTVGCWSKKHTVTETMPSSGWMKVIDHPIKTSAHNLVGLDNGAMVLFGGMVSNIFQSTIWQLKDDEWTNLGQLTQSTTHGSAIYAGRSIYSFSGFSRKEPFPIQRIDLTDEEDVEKVELISSFGNRSEFFFFPILIETGSNDFCL